MRRMVLSILVENTAGVLSRISGLFSRRGYNISSLTVAETQNPDVSRMTVVACGDDRILDQIRNQLAKLEDVIEIKELGMRGSVCRELMLVKIAVGVKERQAVVTIADLFHAKIVDVTVDSLMMELTGNQDKIDAFIKMLDEFTIVELVRTGITGLLRANFEDYEDFEKND